MLKKDKQKVLGEYFDNERIKTFLEYEAYGDIDPDYHVLEKAYRGMIEENFVTFIKFFVDANKNINAKNSLGNTFLQTIRQHRCAEGYIDALINAGAK
ncbi:MAG: PA4642 family protein [Gammaproteobacteria bacterium]|nr:PA4642 family protein [Gammaproteobacteria bacterium]